MKKNIKKVLLLVFVLVLIFLAYLLVNLNNKEKMKNAPATNTPVDQNSTTSPDGQEPKKSAADFVPEMMTEAEKTEMKLSPQLKLQVISRGADGKVEAYKIIRNDSDIINLNQ
jgi:hypothetical protein